MRESVQEREIRLLRLAFLIGAITDGLALVPMLVPEMGALLWGFRDSTGSYRFAMGYGSSLMLGWTVLLLWARRSPLERRFVAALTVLVLYGLVIAEVVAVASGTIPAWRMAPTWVLQTGLLLVFASAYHYRTLYRWAVA